MRISKYLQNHNPSQIEIEKQYNNIEYIVRQIHELKRELNNAEKSLLDLETSQYVIAGLNEPFWDHVSNVEYIAGYYQTLDAAHKLGETEYALGGYCIYDLTGKLIFRSYRKEVSK